MTPHALQVGGAMQWRLGVPTTYFLLRARAAGALQCAYVGLAPMGAHAMVARPVQARRFASIEDAQRYLSSTGRDAGEFDIEARWTD